MADIAELFGRDPLSLTQDDITTVCEEMRRSRHQFNAGNLKAGTTKPKTPKQKERGELLGSLKISL